MKAGLQITITRRQARDISEALEQACELQLLFLWTLPPPAGIRTDPPGWSELSTRERSELVEPKSKARADLARLRRFRAAQREFRQKVAVARKVAAR